MRILTIGTAAPSDRVEAYVESHSGTFVFPTVYDDGELLKQVFGIRAFPTFVLLGADGRIHMIHRGGGMLKSPQFQALVK